MTTFIGNKQLLKEICSTLLEIKKYGRAIESNADSLEALSANDATTVEQLQHISACGKDAAKMATILYNSLAREAFDE